MYNIDNLQFIDLFSINGEIVVVKLSIHKLIIIILTTINIY